MDQYSFMVTVDIFLWAFYAVFCLHVVEESILEGGFVRMVQEEYWPKYGKGRFYLFNASVFFLFGLSILSYEYFGAAFLPVPLTLACGFAANGLWHLWRTFIKRSVAPGVFSGQIYIVLLFLFYKIEVLSGSVPLSVFELSALAGLIIHSLMIYSLRLGAKWYPNG